MIMKLSEAQMVIAHSPRGDKSGVQLCLINYEFRAMTMVVCVGREAGQVTAPEHANNNQISSKEYKIPEENVTAIWIACIKFLVKNDEYRRDCSNPERPSDHLMAFRGAYNGIEDDRSK